MKMSQGMYLRGSLCLTISNNFLSSEGKKLLLKSQQKNTYSTSIAKLEDGISCSHFLCKDTKGTDGYLNATRSEITERK